MKTNLLYVFLSVLFIFQFSVFAQNDSNPEITAKEIKAHLTYLASDEMKGRFTGSKECLEAAEYIQNEFKQYGLKPLFNKSYLQSYPFIETIKMSEDNSLSFTQNGNTVKPILNEGYITAPFSGSARVKGSLVFAGYGISASNLNYDDYKNIDVKGKIVIVMRNSPEYNVPHSKFDQYSALRYKASNARDKGATGIIFVNGFEPKDEEDKLIDFKYDRAGAIEDFCAVQVKRNYVVNLLKAAGKDFASLQNLIDSSKSPASFEINDASASIQTGIKEVEKNSWNVAGYLEGNDPDLKNQYVVIGAHFDHLGMGQTGSLYRGDTPMVHNGADDNASGTVGLLEIAEKFASVKKSLKRSIIFVSFSGEELGLLGSNYFVNHSPIPTSNMVAMLNMDMIGRLNDKNQLIVYGTGTSDNFKDLLNKYNNYNFDLTFNDEGFGPSDQSSFYGKEMPVLFFFTGTHSDYHMPTDDADKINFSGEENVLNYVYSIASYIDKEKTKPNYLLVKKEEKRPMGRTKVYVGTVPDFAGNVQGYKLSGVSEGSPAQKAGLIGGDVMIKFGDKTISNIYDFTYALGDYAPGDSVKVVVKRGDKELTFNIELGSR